MDGKIVLLMIAVVAVGMFALPSTLALYSGQHTFLNGSEVSCDKCHGAASGVTWNGGVAGEIANDTNTTHKTLDCGDCHDGAGYTQGTDFHAATALGAGCIVCHATGIGNVTLGTNVTAELQASGEVHDQMTTDDATQDYACIACHTEASVMGSTVNLTNSYGASNITLNITGSAW